MIFSQHICRESGMKKLNIQDKCNSKELYYTKGLNDYA